jgi:hypothetical protein
MLGQLHCIRSEDVAKDRDGKVRIARAAHEDIHGREVALGPCVNADVGLRQHDHAGYAAAFPELMHVGMQNGCAGRTRGLAKRRFHSCGIRKVAGAPEIQQQMAASVAEAVFVDEIIRANPDIAAARIPPNNVTANANLMFAATVLQHFVLFPRFRHEKLSKGRVDI